MKLIRTILFLFAAVVLASAPLASAAPQKSAAAAKQASLIDINTASADELKTLPGIGDAFAKKIVDNRPYKSKAELVSKKIIPAGTYAKIRDKVVAHQQK